MRPLVARCIIASVLGLLLVLVLLGMAQRQEAADLVAANGNSTDINISLKEKTWFQSVSDYIVGLFNPINDQSDQMRKFQPVRQGYLNHYRRMVVNEQESLITEATSLSQQSLITNNSIDESRIRNSNESHYSTQGNDNQVNVTSADVPKTFIRNNEVSQQIDPIATNKMNREAPVNDNNNYNEQTNSSVKCSNNKFDRLIAQRISQNTLSRPVKTSNGRFDNPFPSWTRPSMIDIAKFLIFEADESNLPKDKNEIEKELPMVKPNFIRDGQNFAPKSQREEYRVTWIGHSTLLIQVDGYNILTDPVFSDRASFSQYVGPKRIREPACSIDDLPQIDIVLVSHNHYDHLDSNSVKRLNERFGRQCRWIVPLGIGEYLQSMMVENYVELDWWQKDCFSVDKQVMMQSMIGPVSMDTNDKITAEPQIQSDNHEDSLADRNNRLELDIYLTPSQHWSRRGINDVNKSLWGSFTIVSRSGSTFFFAGDTGYCSEFKEIGKVFGPFVGAAIPIGAYKPRWFLKRSHIDPAEAIQIHRDLRSMKSIAIHHSTFILSYEDYREPVKMLKEIMDQFKINGQVKEPFVALKHGETIEFQKNR